MTDQRWSLPALLLLIVALLPVRADAQQALVAVPGHPPARDFDLRDLDGKRHRLSDYRGKVVIINFWATWCPPCRREMPSMQRAWERLESRGVLLLAINVGQREEQVWSFASEAQLTFPILLDDSGQTTSSWPVIGLPTTYVIDPQGRMVYRAVGDREWDDPVLLAPVLALVNQAQASRH